MRIAAAIILAAVFASPSVSFAQALRDTSPVSVLRTHGGGGPSLAPAKTPFASLRPDTVLHLGKTADWVLPTEDAVWIGSTRPFAVHRIDPANGKVRQTVRIAPGSYNPRFADGVVWVSGHDAGVVTAVDADAGKVLAVIPVGAGPRFLAAGDGAVWVLLQGTGEIVRIDPRTYKVTARIAAGLVGKGGDIKFGAGHVWATLMGVPLTKIDAKTNRIERQWVGRGGDSLDFAFNSIWLTDYKAGTLARYPVKTLGAP